MADELLKQAQDLFEGQIDFEGQKKVELLSTTLLIVSGVIAFASGLILQNIHVTLWVGLAGTALTFLVVVPPYPFYNSAPLNWLPGGGVASSLYESGGGGGVEVDGRTVR